MKRTTSDRAAWIMQTQCIGQSIDQAVVVTRNTVNTPRAFVYASVARSSDVLRQNQLPKRRHTNILTCSICILHSFTLL